MKLYNYKEYEYDALQNGNLIATAKCKYYKYNGNIKIVVHNEDFGIGVSTALSTVEFCKNNKKYIIKNYDTITDELWEIVKKKKGYTDGKWEHTAKVVANIGYKHYKKV